MGRGRGGYVDDFTALSTRWDVQAGSLAVSGGALQAATLGDWGINQITNPELAENADRWYSTSFISASRVDSETDPAASSVIAGAEDRWALCGTMTADALNQYMVQTMTLIPGASYRQSALAYGPTGIEGSPVLRRLVADGWPANESASQSNRDRWDLISLAPAAVTAATVRCKLYFGLGTMITSGYKIYFDAILCQRVNAPALLTGWRSPNHVATLSHVSPASGVVPFGYVCRYTDSLNYWELRVLPNTAGNDLQIIQVTDGAETTRAEADVDWTSDDTDELMVDCRGSTIATYHRKSGAGTWTAGPSYASATQGQTSPDVGVMLYEAGVGRLSGFEIRAL